MYKNYKWVDASCWPCFGGSYGSGAYAGAFFLIVDNSAADSYDAIGGRLMFL